MSKHFTYWNSFASVVPLYLDLFPGAFQCCSVRLERLAYTGALMAIRRSSDNALKDFYPDLNGKLSMTSEDGLGTSLATWIGANNGLIYAFYDQTGNGNHWLQATIARQPKIVNLGSLLVDANGLAAPTLSGASLNRFQLAGFGGHAVVDTDMVISTTDSFFVTLVGGATDYSFVAQSGASSTLTSQYYGSPTLFVNGTQPTQVTRNDIYLASIGNNKVLTHQGANTTGLGWSGSNPNFGGYGSGAEMAGSLQFNASFASNQSANRAARHAYLMSRYQ